jgi:hypothetical protein
MPVIKLELPAPQESAEQREMARVVRRCALGVIARRMMRIPAADERQAQSPWCVQVPQWTRDGRSLGAIVDASKWQSQRMWTVGADISQATTTQLSLTETALVTDQSHFFSVLVKVLAMILEVDSLDAEKMNHAFLQILSSYRYFPEPDLRWGDSVMEIMKKTISMGRRIASTLDDEVQHVRTLDAAHARPPLRDCVLWKDVRNMISLHADLSILRKKTILVDELSYGNGGSSKLLPTIERCSHFHKIGANVMRATVKRWWPSDKSFFSGFCSWLQHLGIGEHSKENSHSYASLDTIDSNSIIFPEHVVQLLAGGEDLSLLRGKCVFTYGIVEDADADRYELSEHHARQLVDASIAIFCISIEKLFIYSRRMGPTETARLPSEHMAKRLPSRRLSGLTTILGSKYSPIFVDDMLQCIDAMLEFVRAISMSLPRRIIAIYVAKMLSELYGEICVYAFDLYDPKTRRFDESSLEKAELLASVGIDVYLLVHLPLHCQVQQKTTPPECERMQISVIRYAKHFSHEEFEEM